MDLSSEEDTDCVVTSTNTERKEVDMADTEKLPEEEADIRNESRDYPRRGDCSTNPREAAPDAWPTTDVPVSKSSKTEAFPDEEVWPTWNSVPTNSSESSTSPSSQAEAITSGISND